MAKPFLRADWRHLVMLNYEIERDLLEPFVPTGTNLDTYRGQAYVSMVGFLFLKTRLKEVPVPFYQRFEEVNLRFYVRRFSGDEWRRGVVFIKEVVPHKVTATIARAFYNENYFSLPMRHQVDHSNERIAAAYEWKFKEGWHQLSAEANGSPSAVRPGSLEEFITEHYWGYMKQRDGSTLEYQVEHPPWRVWTANQWKFNCDVCGMYGAAFEPRLRGEPSSAFIAEGSAVTVHEGVRISAS